MEFLNIFVLLAKIIGYFYSRVTLRISAKQYLAHKKSIKAELDPLMYSITHERHRRKMYLINLNKGFDHIPKNNEGRFIQGQDYDIAEIKGIKYEGVEFFVGMSTMVYREKIGGRLTFINKGEDSDEAFIAHLVGTVPFNWIQQVDIDGEDISEDLPIVYCYFNSWPRWPFWKTLHKKLMYRFPYNKLVYYRRNENYDKNFPFTEDELIEEKINEN